MKKAILSILISSLIILPFGNVFAQGTNYRYTGQENDPSSNLYYYGQRYYDPNVGRFTQPDPVSKYLNDPQKLKQATGQDLQKFLENPQALNEYSYTQNNPVIYIDPEGEFNFETNQVEKGDTLRGVFGNNWQEVSNYNNLSNPDLIYPGQHLNLPVFFQKDSWQKVIDAIYTFVPGFSDVRDVYEAITKTDFIEGRALTPGEESLTVPAALIVGVLSGKEIRGISKLDSWLKSKLGDTSDWIRFGRTHIPKEISKTETDVFTWGVKGGGVNSKTGFKLSFHYHIHKYNWYKPWTWTK